MSQRQRRDGTYDCLVAFIFVEDFIILVLDEDRAVWSTTHDDD
jgi:hypothetical protein